MSKSQEPKLIRRFLEWYCDAQLLESILGDLSEKYVRNQARHGRRNARILYGLQALGFLRPIFSRKKTFAGMNTMIWRNYLRTIFRSFKKRKMPVAINLVGLTFAITASLYCYLLVQDEFTFDLQHERIDDVYRLYKHYSNPEEQIDHLTVETSGLMGPTMKTEFPEVETIVRICPWWDHINIFNDDELYRSSGWYFADSTFFDVFNFQLLRGNPKTVLSRPGSVVLAESLSRQIFGHDDPVGQTIIGLNEVEYTVTGIVADCPRKSSLQFDVLCSWTTTVPEIGQLAYSWMNNWLAQGIFTYVRLQPNSNVDGLVAKLPGLMQSYFPERAEQYTLLLQPFRRSYLHSTNMLNQRGMKLGNIRFIYVFLVSATLILIISVLNYINISLSQAKFSLTEVGIRKALGSSKPQLLYRFVLETFTNSLIAVVVAVTGLWLFWDSMNVVFGQEIPVSNLLQFSVFGYALLFCLILSLLAGLYPAVVQSQPEISLILKNSVAIGKNAGQFRRGMLGIQYGISIVLIICAIVIFNQTSYLKNKPLGFSKDNLMVVNLENEVRDQLEGFRTMVEQHPDVEFLSIGRSAIGSGSYSTTFIPEGKPTELGTRIFIVDDQFFKTYQIPVVEGRSFLQNSSADSLHVIVNRSFQESVGWKNSVGRRIKENE